MRCKNVLCGAAVSSARKVEQGDAFLPGVDMADIESLHAGSTDYKVKCMLQAARLKAMQFIGADIQSSQNCKKYRLCVTAASGCRRHQTHTRREESWKAMPPLLNKKNRLRRDLGKNPTKCGFLRGSWTAKIVACHIKNRFKVHTVQAVHCS